MQYISVLQPGTLTTRPQMRSGKIHIASMPGWQTEAMFPPRNNGTNLPDCLESLPRCQYKSTCQVKALVTTLLYRCLNDPWAPPNDCYVILALKRLRCAYRNVISHLVSTSGTTAWPMHMDECGKAANLYWPQCMMELPANTPLGSRS
jgi:hypothetical protein